MVTAISYSVKHTTSASNIYCAAITYRRRGVPGFPEIAMPLLDPIIVERIKSPGRRLCIAIYGAVVANYWGVVGSESGAGPLEAAIGIISTKRS